VLVHNDVINPTVY